VGDAYNVGNKLADFIFDTFVELLHCLIYGRCIVCIFSNHAAVYRGAGYSIIQLLAQDMANGLLGLGIRATLTMYGK
jgi:hypothetical protein